MQRILVVDDDPGIRDIFQIIFERAGYELQVKSNGYDIINNNYSLPDLFLIDKQLSGICGLDICRYLKNHDQTKHVPVLIISASPDLGPQAEAAGADGYIEKPFELKHLINTVRNHLRRNSTKRAAL